MQYTLKRNWILAASVLLVGLAILIVYSRLTLGSITKDDPVETNRFQNYTFFATSTNQVVSNGLLNYATSTASATSTSINSYTDSSGRVDNGYFVVKGAKRVEVYFGRGTASSTNNGSSFFFVQTSPNGTDWYNFGKLILASTTNQTLLSNGNISVSTSTIQASLNLDFDSVYAIRCIVTQSALLVDGTNTCSASADW